MKKDILWNSIGTTAWSFLSLFLLIIVTRVNGITSSGKFSFAFAFAIIMFTVCGYGGRAYQVSDHKNSFPINSYISLRLFTSVIVLAFTVLFVLANNYDLEKSLIVFILVGQRIFDSIADVLYGIMQKRRQLYLSGKSLFYKSLLSFAVFLLIDLLTKSLLLSTISLPVISLLFVLFYDIPRARKLETFSIKPNFTRLRAILRSTFLPFATTIMGLIFVNTARYFIDIYHPELQGYFGIIIMPLSLTILLFSFVSMPATLPLSERFNNKEYAILRKQVSKIIGLILFASLLLCAMVYMFGAPLLRLLFNVDFTAYVFDIILVILIGLAISLTSLFTNIAVIARKLKATAVIYLVSNIYLIFLCTALIGKYQIRGAIMAYVIASATQTILMAAYYYRLTGTYKLSRNS